jgi:hypothetical protein
MAFIAPVCYAVARPKLEWGIARGIMPLALVNVLNVVSGLIGLAASRPCITIFHTPHAAGTQLLCQHHAFA